MESGKRVQRVSLTGEDEDKKQTSVVANLRNAVTESHKKNGVAGYPIKVQHRGGQIVLVRADLDESDEA